MLRLSWCWAWRQEQQAKEENRQAQVAKLQASLFGVPTAATKEVMTPKMVRETSEAALSHARAERERGRLTEMDGVYQVLEGVLVTIRDAAMGMPNRLERELNLTPAQTRIVERAMEEMLDGAHNTIADSILGAGFEPNLDMDPQIRVLS